MNTIPFDSDTIQRLAEILKETGLSELDLRDGDRHLKLVRAAPTVVAAPAPVAAAPAPVAAPAPAVAPAAPSEEPPPPAGAVTSPMVGVAYLSPEPGAAPYVSVGQVVSAGQTVLLIEAMKTFNQIKAPKSGTVTQILVTSGSPVEYGQPLLVIA